MQKLSVKIILSLLLTLLSWVQSAHAGNVSVTRTGNGSGTVVSNLGQTISINCGSTCTVTFTDGAPVTLTANSATGSRFDHWVVSGTDDAILCNNSTSPTCAFNSSATGANVQAVFVPSYNLTVIKNGSGTDYGRVTSTPAGVDCGGVNDSNTGAKTTDCTEGISPGQRVTLTADPNTAEKAFFGGWQVFFLINGTWTQQTNICTGLALQCNVTMAYDVQVWAKFDLNFILTLQRQGSGEGSIIVTDPSTGTYTTKDYQNICTDTLCSQTYVGNTPLTLTAIETNNSSFQGWLGACSTFGAAKTCTITMDQAKNVIAIFNPKDPSRYGLTLIKEGSGSNEGKVVAAAEGTGDGIDCQSGGSTTQDCTGLFAAGQGITLTATTPNGATSGAVFSRWQVYYLNNETPPKYILQPNMCTGLEPICHITMAAPAQVRAQFDLGFILTVVRDGTGKGNIVSNSPDLDACTKNICNQTFNLNKEVTLTAVADSSSKFAGWKGACADARLSGINKETCTITMDKAYLATATFNSVASIVVSTKGAGTGTVTSSPTGILCDGSANSVCATNFNSGAGVTLTATPTAGSKFIQWGGVCASRGATPSCSITVTTESQATEAYFELIADNTRLLTIDKSGTGTGNIISFPSGIDCGTDCFEKFAADSTVTLIAVNNTGSEFGGWTGEGTTATRSAPCGTALTCDVSMSVARSVSASFNLSSRLLTVVKDGSGSGRVLSIPQGIDCGEDCTEAYAKTITVTLSALAENNSRFIGWKDESGTAICAGATTCAVSMSTAHLITATFNSTLAISIKKSGTGLGFVTSDLPGISCGSTCSANFNSGTGIRLTATPEEGSRFKGWKDTVCASRGAQPICDLTVTNTAQIIEAEFEVINGPLLSITKSGNGLGTITDSGSNIDCGTVCAQNFTLNATVTLTAKPSSGSSFGGWGGECSNRGTFPTCTVTLDQAKSVSAVFSLSYTLTVTTNGSGTGIVASNPAGISCGSTCQANFASGTLITLTASATNDASFSGWGGACSASNTATTCQVTLDQILNVTATFSNLSLGKSLGNSDLFWNTGGNAPWFGQIDGSNNYAVSGKIGSNQQSWIETTVTGPGRLSFVWGVASELDRDILVFQTDNIETKISGQVAQQVQTYDLPQGIHILRWTYVKDGDISRYEDRGLLARVTFDTGNTISVNLQGNGFGSVVSAPNGINCGTACTSGFVINTAIKLTANSLGGSQFAGWSGACSGTNPVCLVTVNTARNVTATFNWVNNTNLLTDAALNLGLLNDTGIDWCSNSSTNYLVDKESKCNDPTMLSNYANQDAHIGRDAYARKGQLSKLGQGSAGFDYTKVCNNGAFAGEGDCKAEASQGTADNDWGCTLDNVTGLIWEVKSSSGSRSKDLLYTWFNANDFSNGGSKGENCTGELCNTERYVNEVNKQGLCGATDWRLPSRKELHSIVHHGQSNPAIDLSFFPNTVSGGYWTATPAAAFPFNAWYVDFAAGWDFWDVKSNQQHIRLVRTCDNCTLQAKTTNPVFRDAKLTLPLVNAEGQYYSAELKLSKSNPLTFDVVKVDSINAPRGRRANDTVYYYLNGTLVIGGVEVGNEHYNAMLEKTNSNGTMRFVLRDAHLVH